MARSDLWTREQLIMALNVYFKIQVCSADRQDTHSAENEDWQLWSP